MTWAAPAARAAWTAHSPTGPRPSTATLSPGRTGRAAWKPVPITSPAKSATSLAIPSGTRRSVRLAWGTSACSAWVPCSAAEGGAVAEGPRALALVVVAGAARAADGAGHLEAAEDAVADRDRAHRVAGRHDGADVLVADGEARLDGHAAVEDVQVAAAHAGGLDADDRVVGGLQLGVGALVDAHLARRLEGDRVHQGCTLTTTAPSRGATR